ncbi:uncharacterized protein SETTUDRAFT_168027 [Exserohilum turcica Et28A]|uniref:Uncharacterized protein n=1 Tax=Exserohilum turcicum (strain 28A) TaxID=671987 RepID=R0KHS4_EXST2|nr:uncharacterized protein SETTUDRAFT_168027 [Exserohilum turcica Et28A]EOA88779.1 hypothetical protein SETTUDRAFT_168027 [Exserohilum turcica Et28A]
MVPNVALTAQTPPARIPRLKYRNPLPAHNVPHTAQGTAPHRAYSSQDAPTTLAPESSTTRSPAAIHSLSKPTSVTSSSLASLASTASSTNDARSSRKKKKASSVLGFLSLKEPSQAALDQYAQQQRKQTASSASSTPQSRATPTHATQPLPHNVPKVNSKWDGVPESVKSRSSTSSNASARDNKSGVLSRSSFSSSLKSNRWNDSKLSIMTDGTRNPPNSIASISVSSLSVHDMVQSPTSSAAAPSFPDGPVTPPSTHGTGLFSSQSTLKMSDSTSSERPSLDGSTHSRPDSPASSMSSADTIIMDTADTIFRKMSARPNQAAWGGEEDAAESPQDCTPDYVPESHDFLFQTQPTVEPQNDEQPATFNNYPVDLFAHYSPIRPVQNFSRPTGPQGQPIQRKPSMSLYRRTPSAPALPTLYEASVTSLDEDEDKEEEDGNEDAYSIAPSTIAPSELSKHWYESPRERLGLGRRLQINDVLPWEEQKGAAAPCGPRRFPIDAEQTHQA